ncbi:MAG: hypothetical protein HYU36_02725 [Planctomycetes bacterium]|nr:hypothetical protein [Planctomycetota bacterium]
MGLIQLETKFDMEKGIAVEDIALEIKKQFQDRFVIYNIRENSNKSLEITGRKKTSFWAWPYIKFNVVVAFKLDENRLKIILDGQSMWTLIAKLPPFIIASPLYVPLQTSKVKRVMQSVLDSVNKRYSR